MVAAGDEPVFERAGEPGPPDLGRIALDVQVVVLGFEQQGRAPDLPAGRPVRGFVVAVDAQAGPVVLAHAVYHGRVAQRRPQVGVVAIAHRGRGGRPVPGVR